MGFLNLAILFCFSGMVGLFRNLNVLLNSVNFNATDPQDSLLLTLAHGRAVWGACRLPRCVLACGGGGLILFWCYLGFARFNLDLLVLLVVDTLGFAGWAHLVDPALIYPTSRRWVQELGSRRFGRAFQMWLSRRLRGLSNFKFKSKSYLGLYLAARRRLIGSDRYTMPQPSWQLLVFMMLQHTGTTHSYNATCADYTLKLLLRALRVLDPEAYAEPPSHPSSRRRRFVRQRHRRREAERRLYADMPTDEDCAQAEAGRWVRSCAAARIQHLCRGHLRRKAARISKLPGPLRVMAEMHRWQTSGGSRGITSTEPYLRGLGRDDIGARARLLILESVGGPLLRSTAATRIARQARQRRQRLVEESAQACIVRELRWHVLRRSSIQVFVRGLPSPLAVDITPDSRVCDLMHEIERRTRVRHSCQRLVFEGHQMETDATLRRYGVRAMSTVHLMTRVLGGADPPESPLRRTRRPREQEDSPEARRVRARSFPQDPASLTAERTHGGALREGEVVRWGGGGYIWDGVSFAPQGVDIHHSISWSASPLICLAFDLPWFPDALSPRPSRLLGGLTEPRCALSFQQLAVLIREAAAQQNITRSWVVARMDGRLHWSASMQEWLIGVAARDLFQEQMLARAQESGRELDAQWAARFREETWLWDEFCEWSTREVLLRQRLEQAAIDGGSSEAESEPDAVDEQGSAGSDAAGGADRDAELPDAGAAADSESEQEESCCKKRGRSASGTKTDIVPS